MTAAVAARPTSSQPADDAPSAWRRCATRPAASPTSAIRPLAAELDEIERIPAELYDEMAALGLFGIAMPKRRAGPAPTSSPTQR